MEMLRKKISLLPDHPGVYMMKNAVNRIIYVGKAKVLKNRVRSYFTGSHDQKTQKLLSEITDFEYIITSSEVEALLLECNLIKKYNPPYNIMLRDDKSYPYILITTEEHPRIIVTRKVNKNAGKFFGPYPNAAAARETARLLNRLLPLRKCNRIPNKPCLYYHIGQCLGPCTNDIIPSEYADILEKATMFLRGNQRSIITWLEGRMKKASADLLFEAAKEYRDLIADLKKITEKQNITFNDFRNRDIVAYANSQELISIQIFCFRQGNLVTRDSFIFPYFSEPEEAFITFLVQYYLAITVPEEICIPELQSTSVMDLFPLIIPKRGKARELVKLASSNAENLLLEKIALENHKSEEINKALASLAEILKIPQVNTIEAFDISGLSGTNVVGGMVQFKEGKPARSNYRKYNILPLKNNNDDTAYLKHVISRRYSRLLKEQSSLPDLILVDGGKGHVKAAIASLRELGIGIPVAGMLKDDRHETRSLLNQSGSEVLSDEGYPEAFRLIQRIQDEVHRFAITFHRQQRLKNMITSELDEIPGIGLKRKRLLLRYFQTIDGIKNASAEELRNAGLPINVAFDVLEYFNKGKTR